MKPTFSHRTPYVGIVVPVIVVVVIIAGFAIYEPVTVITVPYVSTSVTVVSNQVVTAVSSHALSIGSTTIQPGEYASSSSPLTTGEDVQVTWSADDTVDVYVFDSSQYSAFSSSRTTSPNIAGQTNSQSRGTFGFQVSFDDTYYLVIHNGHTGPFFGMEAHNVEVFGATGTATYQRTVSVYTTQTLTFTLTSEATNSCSYRFWNWLLARPTTCP